MSSQKLRFRVVTAGALWVAVIAGAAWLTAAYGRKGYYELTPVELLDGFIPTQVRSEVLLHGGSVVVTASARDGSYTLHLNQAFGDPARIAEREIWLGDVGPLSVNAVIKPGSAISGALQRNLRRAIDAGGASGKNVELVIAYLDGSAAK